MNIRIKCKCRCNANNSDFGAKFIIKYTDVKYIVHVANYEINK